MNDHSSRSPDQIPERDKPGYLNAALALAPLCSVGLLVIALFQLGMGGGLAGWIKIGLIAAAAYLVSYAIFRMAIEKSATLATFGYKSAMIVGGFSIVLVGLTFFIATAAGLTMPSVEEKRLQAHVEALRHYADTRIGQSGNAEQVVPAMESIVSDAGAKFACETETSCVSNKGNGGYGTTAKMLEAVSGRAKSIAEALRAGMLQRDDRLGGVAALLSDMEAVIADEGRSVWDRRRALRELDTRLGKALNALDAATPTPLIKAFAAELRGPVPIEDSAVAARVFALLSGYATSLDVVLDQEITPAIDRPAFPERTGAMETFRYAGDFAPVIMVAFLVDMIFPLTLWLYTLKTLDWLAFEKNPARKRTERDRTVFDDLTEAQVWQHPERMNGALPRPVTHRPQPRSRKS